MTLKAGAAQIIITPPVGLELAGWGFGPSVGILDDLEAQALVLDSASQQVAIVTTDLIGIGADLAHAVRRRVEATWGIPAHNILLSASHTHSGPAAAFYRHWGAMDEGYLRGLESHLVGLVGMAQRNLQDATLGCGLGMAEGLSVNRRDAAGMTDPAVPVIRIDGREGKPIAVVWNYACHPVSLHSYRNLISPDYPGYARQVIRGVLGRDVVVLFTLGAAGDINPANFRWKQNTPERSWQTGAALGCEVTKTALRIECQPGATIGVAQASVDLPLEPLPSPAELESIRSKAAADAEMLQGQGRAWDDIANALVDRDWAGEALKTLASGEARRTMPCDLQAIRLGEAALAAMPLEVFVETGLAIKRASPARATFLSTNSNGALGYLPTRAAYEGEDYTNPRGRAPKVYGLYAFAPGAEPAVRRAASEIVAALFE